MERGDLLPYPLMRTMHQTLGLDAMLPRSGAAARAERVQDEASQLVPLVVAARPGERVLDVCASPGGKTTAIAADMQHDSLGVVQSISERRGGNEQLHHDPGGRRGPVRPSQRRHSQGAEIADPLCEGAAASGSGDAGGRRP